LCSLPWPRKGDLLIGPPAQDRDESACVNWSWDLFGTYAMGYRKAAEVCFHYVAAERWDQDSLVYPIFFLWRHHVELMLKGLIRKAHQVRGEVGKFPKHHRVLALWREFRPILESIAPVAAKEDREDLQNVEHVIKQLDAIDEESMTFRYPVTQKGEPTLPKELQHINLRNLHDVMDGIATFLDAVDTMLDHRLDMKAEMDAEVPPIDES